MTDNKREKELYEEFFGQFSSASGRDDEITEGKAEHAVEVCQAYAAQAVKEALEKVKEKQITRFEIIDHTKSVEDGGGRQVIVSPDSDVTINYELQDGGKTLKIFLEKK